MFVRVALILLLIGCHETAVPVAPTGAELFRENGCATCHGPLGRGDGTAARGTALHPRNLADRTSYRNGTSAEAIARTIGTGLRTMPAFAHIPPDERRAIAEFIVSLQEKEK